MLITDADYTLAWNRDKHRGRGVGSDEEYDSRQAACDCAEASDVEALLALLENMVRLSLKS